MQQHFKISIGSIQYDLFIIAAVIVSYKIFINSGKLFQTEAKEAFHA